MAIEIEQQSSSVNWVTITSVAVIILVLFAGAYFLFFKSPELIDVVAPGDFESIKQISEIDLNAEDLLDSPKFRMLRQFSIDASPPEPGRANPFQPPAQL